MITDYNQFFDVLASNNSGNFKLEQLKSNKSDALLKEIAFQALNPMILFFIKKIPEYIPNNVDPTMSLDRAIGELKYLSDRTYTGNAGIAHLRNVLESVSPDDALVVERIIEKDLWCGVSVATVNKVWPGLVQDFPIMLCSPSNEKTLKKMSFPAIVEEKYDGARFNAIVLDGNVTFWTRNGKPIDLRGYMEEEFRQMADGRDIVFDGELLFDDGGLADRKKGNGIVTKCIRGTASDKEASGIVAVVWDLIPYEYWSTGSCYIPYKDRLMKLAGLSGNVVLSDKIRVAEHAVVDSLDEATAIYERYLSEGKEGIIIKDMSGTWENKRTKSQLKMKAELVCELKCVDILGGTGKYKGKIGALECESSDGLIKVSVGTGLTDEDREKNCMEYINKIVSIKYNARIKPKSGPESLFLPVFLEVREDKDEADHSMNIK